MTSFLPLLPTHTFIRGREKDNMNLVQVRKGEGVSAKVSVGRRLSWHWRPDVGLPSGQSPLLSPLVPHLPIPAHTATPAWPHSTRRSPLPSSGPLLRPARTALWEEGRGHADHPAGSPPSTELLPQAPRPSPHTPLLQGPRRVGHSVVSDTMGDACGRLAEPSLTHFNLLKDPER